MSFINLSRRHFAGSALAATSMLIASSVSANPVEAPMRMPAMADSGPKLKVAMLVYQGMIFLDMACPQTVLNVVGSDIHLVGATMAPVNTDIGISLAPTTSYERCPHDLDVLFVPGGLMGTIGCMRDDATLDFLGSRALSAKYVTSVCTGTLVLAAAGLLRGYRATAHWGVIDLLSLMGAIPVHERVVQDRNRLTGAGTTAGLDFGLTLAALLRGEDVAKNAQLILEYAPRPPFQAGSPVEIGEVQFAKVRKKRIFMDEDARSAARRLGISS